MRKASFYQTRSSYFEDEIVQKADEVTEFYGKMKKFECLVKQGSVTKPIVRYFKNEEYAYAWLSLEGYTVLWIREC